MENFLRETVSREQFRELERRLSELTDTVDTISTTTADEVVEVIPPLVNFADNTDFIYSDELYNVNGSTYLSYTDDEDVLANWYSRVQATVSSWLENTSSVESSESIRSSAHGSGARAGAEWNTTEGSLQITGGYRVATRLKVKSANAGNYFAVNLQLSRVLGKAAPTPSIKLKVSLWDNTDNRTIRGNYPPLTSSKIGHTGGAGETVTRQYILEVVMPDGRTFYSDTASFTTGANQVVNSVSPTSVDSTKYVNISWPTVIGEGRYRLYRRTPAGTDTNWYHIGTITNGTTQFSDFGGTSGGVWTVPTFDTDKSEYQWGHGFIEDIGELLQTEDLIREISVGIRVPFNFVPNGNQFLQIEFLKEDYTATTSTEIVADGIRIDHVGLCYTNGRWCPSARDNAVGAGITVNPPPSGGGGGGNPDGGGGSYCVEERMRVLVWSDDGFHFYLPANKIIRGDRLVSWDYKNQRLAPSKVGRVIKGLSRTNHILSTEENELICSFSHRLIPSFEDFEDGVAVKYVKNSTLGWLDGTVKEVEIIGKEILETTMRVVTFTLSPNANYIAEGFLSHNVKPVILID